MLNVGEQIHSSVTGKTYIITWGSDKIANAEVGFASANDGEYFIKRHVNTKYPMDDAPLSASLKESIRRKCENDYKKNLAVYKAVKNGCHEDGACVPILDYFREGAFYYTVYNKINAESLSINQISALTKKEKYTLLLRLIQGLQPLNTLGIIHGDLKPENILVQRNGANWRIRLIDMDDCYRAGQPKEPGAVLGTIDYYSPELAKYNTYEVENWEDAEEQVFIKRMAQDLTTKSDIFALGIIFCEFYGGERPYSTDGSVHTICEAAVKGCLELPSSVSCDSKISALIRKMLDGNYRARPSLGQVGDDLRKINQNRLVPPEIEFKALDKDGNIFNCSISTYSDGYICYTLDGTEPTTMSARYNDPIRVPLYTTVKAIVADGKRRSDVMSKMAWIKRDHTLQPQIVVKGKSVTILTNDKSPQNTQIYYTLDGSKPTSESTLYSEPFIASAGVTRVKAIAITPGAVPSLTTMANVYKNKVCKPNIHYKLGVVSMEPVPGCDIYYTIDDSTPTMESNKYTGPFKLTNTEKFHVMAICIDNEDSVSEIAEIKRPTSIVMSKKK